MAFTYTEAENLIAQFLKQQRELKNQLKEVDPTTLDPEQLADYSYCLTKNFVVIKKLETLQIQMIIDKMNENEEELKKGIENLENVIEKLKTQASIFGFLDKIIAVTVSFLGIIA